MKFIMNSNPETLSTALLINLEKHSGREQFTWPTDYFFLW